jgi:hypothetical protein
MPRSGSTLIEQILASHPQIHGAGELQDLEIATGTVLSFIGNPLPFPECVPVLDGATLRRIGQSYLARLRGRRFFSRIFLMPKCKNTRSLR